MSHHEILFYWLIVPSQFVLCLLAYLRKIQRQMPVFAAYLVVILSCNIINVLAFHHFGFRSIASYYVGWMTIGVDTLARSLAVVDLCRFGLRAYQGIWILASRLLAMLALFFLAHAAVDAWGQPDRLAIYGLTIERDVGTSSVVILIALLLIRKYYGLSLEPLHRSIAVGICFLCIMDVVNNTMLRDLFTGYLFSWFSTSSIYLWPAMRPQIERAHDLWNTVRFLSFMASLSIWGFALRKPLPAPAQDPVLLPAEIYGELSPAINLRLRAFNNRLEEMLKS